ncbi:hypothetical protein P691DRAFT_813205 [Macrolepiota fuliginosa MF-IS2]|uniref:NACHT domain-containing protein n=1 Tax=Macrolepiota fuliginosa MF-IS2 TaxID=1400762 RepID=A0A9P6BX96_9AGAR|nr:hypothetical protein P691DRAFT_813205 [Macrolepiota fuliginosa MF-IS2]
MIGKERNQTEAAGNTNRNDPNVQGRERGQKGAKGISGQDGVLSPTAGSPRSVTGNTTPHAGSFGGAHNFAIGSLTMIEGDIPNEGQSIKFLSEHIIVGAEFDSSDHRLGCHPETRLDISRNIQSWVHNLARKYKILWLHGPAGVGKSAILQTIAETEADSLTSILGATLFFSRPNDRNDPQRVFITIAYRLSMKYFAYRKYIVELLTFDPTIVKKSMQEQFKAFIVQPFAIKELLAGSHDTVLIVLDGLDECEGDHAQREIILLIGKFTLRYPTSPLIWLIASRLEIHLQDAFSEDAVQLSYGEIQVDVDSDEGRRDVEKYLWDSFTVIRKRFRRSIPSSLQQWPSESDFSTIATRSSGLFIFPSTIIRFVGDEDYADPTSRLKIVLNIIESTTLSTEGNNPFTTLDALYTRILSEVPPDVLQTTLNLLAFRIMFGGWPFAEVCNWLGVPQGRAYGALRRLHSVLRIPEPENAFEEHLEAFHASFYDYLASRSRSGSLYVRTSEIIQPILLRLVNVLLESHSAEMSDVDATRINLSWPHEKEDRRLELLRDIFRRTLNLLIMVLDEFVNDSVRNEFSRLSAFFQDLDFGEGFRTSSGIYMSAYPISAFSKDLENWGVLKTVPLQSFNYNDVRLDLDLAISRVGEGGLGLRIVWSGNDSLMQRRSLRSVDLVDSQGKSHLSGFLMGNLFKDPDRNVYLEKNLTSWTNMAPSHPITMLGKGRKSCALIQFDVPGEGFWILALPCVQPS